MLGAVIAFLVGGYVGVQAADRARKRNPSQTTAGYRARCQPSVLFVHTGRHPFSKIVNFASGSRGFSHIVLDGCEIDEHGKSLVIDVDRGKGVIRRPLLKATDGKPYVRVYLPLDVGAQLLGCARSKLGEPYSPGAVFKNNHHGTTCANFLQRCLPEHLRIPEPRGRSVAPNDFARAWGISTGGPRVVDLSRNLG